MKFRSLVPCSGPAPDRSCGDGALVETGRICAGCSQAQRRQENLKEKAPKFAVEKGADCDRDDVKSGREA
jgi:hypothetical protein